MNKTSIPRIVNVREKQQPLPDTGPGTFLLTNENSQTMARKGVTQILAAYNEIPWLRAVIGKIASGLSETHWRVFTTDGRARGRADVTVAEAKDAPSWKREKLLATSSARENLTEKPDHPLRKVLINGNARFSGDHVLALAQLYLDLVGESFLLVERAPDGTPVALWNLSPADINELPTKKKPYFRVIVGGHQAQIPITEIIQIQNPNPSDPYGRGSGIADSLADELALTEETAKHLRSFFHNRARPDMIVSANGLSREETKRLEDKWMEKHQGFWNNFKPHFFNRNVEITQLGQSFEDMQISSLRTQQRDTIQQVFGIPPELLGNLADSNRSTIVHAQELFQRQVLQPRIETLRQALQTQLVPMFGDKLLLDYESPVVRDKEHELSVLQSQPGAATVNEWREKMGLPSLGDSGKGTSKNLAIQADVCRIACIGAMTGKL